MQAIVRNLILGTLTVALGGLLTVRANCQGFLHTDGTRIVDGQNQEVILKGMGLGGWMLQEPYMLQLSGVAVNQSQIRARVTELIGAERTTKFYAAWRANHTRRADIDSLASWGFNAIRVPLHYNLFTLPVDQEPTPGGQTWIKTGFDLIDSLLNWCAADHIYLILDLHAAPGGQGNDIAISDRDKTKPSLWQSAANREKMIALWQQLATRYGSSPWIGGYDLLNETNWGFTDSTDEHGCREKINAPLRQLLMDVTATIRKVDAHHLIFIEGNCWANNFQGVLPAWDNNMAISFHKYWNENDQASLQSVLDLRARYHVPLWLGESGENSNTWFTDAISLVQANDIGWTWWPLKKAGLNNPLEFHLDSGFRRIVAYWEGRGPRPSPDSAYDALMRLARGTAANTYHRDVVDAMFRQVSSEKTLPFIPVTLHAGALVYGVNYDLGRNGFAYYDMDSANYRSVGRAGAGNRGGLYRNDGVDITPCADSLSNGYAVMDIQPGEWMQYTINVPAGRKYKVGYRIAIVPAGSEGKGGHGGVTQVSEAFVAPSWTLLDYQPGGTDVVLDSCGTGTGSAADGWQTVGYHAIYLSEGVHHLRFLAQGPGFRLSYIAFE